MREAGRAEEIMRTCKQIKREQSERELSQKNDLREQAENQKRLIDKIDEIANSNWLNPVLKVWKIQNILKAMK